MHSQTPAILHMDLKSPNVLLVSLDHNDPIVAKLGDFGLSGCLATLGGRSVDNPVWLAPEIIRY